MADRTFILNIFMHCIVLFCFLTLFFWLYISSQIRAAINSQIDEAIRTAVPPLMESLNGAVPDLTPVTWENLTADINNLNTTDAVKTKLLALVSSTQASQTVPWDKAYFENLESQYAGDDAYITASNKKYFIINICIIVGLIIAWILMVVYFKKQGDTINFKSIFIENTVLFTFVGIVEYLFFVTVAFKYKPASPAFMIASAIDSIKNQLIDDQNAL